MYITEALLLIVLSATCLYCSVTDIRDGIIKNKVLLGSGVLCCGLNFTYYCFFGQQYLWMFFLDFVVLVILSIVMYAFNRWAAGDSKLLFLIVFAIPARFYDATTGIAPAFFVIVFTFSISFIYIVLESIVLRLKNRDRIHFPMGRNILHFLRDYVYVSAYIIGVNYLLAFLFPDFVGKNASLISMVGLFIAIIVYKYPLFFKLPVIAAVALFSVSIFIIYGLRYGFSPPNFRIYLYVAIVLFFRSISEEYNYKSIPTESVSPGMILSVASVASMSTSKVQGLPRSTTEDMRSRLTAAEVDSILRWKESRYGLPEITIVRKIPFAIFMTCGVFVFLIIRMGVL